MAPVNIHKLSQPIILCCILVFMLLLANPNFVSAFGQRSYVTSSTFNLTLDPSSVVIKVGQNATVNLILANSGEAGEQLCFGQQGFPDSGFILTFQPQCTMLTLGFLRASLSVEATAAAAPQSFTAIILAITGNQTAQAPLTMTVVPGIPPWVPWLIILVFVLGLSLAVVLPSKLSRKARRSTKPKGKRQHQLS
jgi:hypothetical protein